MTFDFSQAPPQAHPQINISHRWGRGRLMSPAQLDRWADAELAHGHVDRAEQLSHRAAELRLTAAAAQSGGCHRSDGLSLAEVYARITRACNDAGGQRAFAGRVGCSEAMISQVLHAKKAPSNRILKAAGLKREVKFVEEGHR